MTDLAACNNFIQIYIIINLARTSLFGFSVYNNTASFSNVLCHYRLNFLLQFDLTPASKPLAFC